MSISGTDICIDALQELNVIQAGDVPDGTMMDFVGKKLKRLFDSWNAKQAAAYADLFSTFTLTAHLSPHTIGLTANTPTWVVTVTRPQRIEYASLIMAGTTDVFLPITLRDREWYDALTVPDLETAIPTDLYYNPSWPNGSLFFYPVPSVAKQVLLVTKVALAQLELTDTFTLPPGYQDAVTLTLSEEIAGPYGKAGSPIALDVARRARERRSVIFDNNVLVPSLQTQDAGMPGGGGTPTGNYLNGWS